MVIKKRLYEWEQKKRKKNWGKLANSQTKIFGGRIFRGKDMEPSRQVKNKSKRERITAITIDVLGQLFVNI